MDYSIVSNYMRITDDPAEMVIIAKQIAQALPNLYTPIMMEKMFEGVERHIPNETPEKKEEMVYRAIYDWWGYGCNVDEEFYLHFDIKTDAEKREYLADIERSKYFDHLNSGGSREIYNILCDKFFLYQRLKPYYMRDMIEIQSEEDFPSFEAFVTVHDTFVVKPLDYWGGRGVHKVSLSDFNHDARAAFESILSEGVAINQRHSGRQPKMVLEELIEQDPALAVLHPNSLNAVRATAVRGKDGKIHLYHPWIKVGMNGTFVASAVFDGFDAEIDPETGIVISDGYQESGKVVAVHPDSGIRMKGFQVPRWDELVSLVDELMEQMPEFGYIGWDLALTPDGWTVVEGNYSGDFMFQLIHGRGFRKEFEDLIGWKMNKRYWWEKDPID